MDLGLLQYSSTQQEMDCPQAKVGLVIGAKGVIIQEIMRRTQCKIVINQDFPEGQPRKVLFTGLPAHIQSAKDLVQAVINDGAIALQSGVSGSVNSEASETFEMECPADKVGLVIGSRGVVIQDIMRRTGCKIIVNQDFPDGHPRKIVYTGKLPQIHEARALIFSILQRGTASGPSESNGQTVTKEMDCPQDKVGLVIGAKGVIIQEMMRRTGCRMVVNQEFPDGCPRRVVFTGTNEQIDAAMELVQAVIAQGPGALHSSGPNVVTQEITIVQALVGRIIGPSGITIKEIQQRCGVKMVVEQDFADSDERKIRISGDAERVQAATVTVYHILENGGAGLAAMGGIPGAQNYGAAQNYYAPATTAGALALGADGQAGQLLPVSVLPSGMHQQIVLLVRSIAGRVIGKNATTINLIKAKSGAALSVEHSPEKAAPQQSANDFCKIIISGTPPSVTLAAQMVQEVLINGPGKLQAMPDYAQQMTQQGMYQYSPMAQQAYAQQQQQYMYQQQQYYGAQVQPQSYVAYQQQQPAAAGGAQSTATSTSTQPPATSTYMAQQYPSATPGQPSNQYPAGQYPNATGAGSEQANAQQQQYQQYLAAQQYGQQGYSNAAAAASTGSNNVGGGGGGASSNPQMYAQMYAQYGQQQQAAAGYGQMPYGASNAAGGSNSGGSASQETSGGASASK